MILAVDQAAAAPLPTASSSHVMFHCLVRFQNSKPYSCEGPDIQSITEMQDFTKNANVFYYFNTKNFKEWPPIFVCEPQNTTVNEPFITWSYIMNTPLVFYFLNLPYYYIKGTQFQDTNITNLAYRFPSFIQQPFQQSPPARMLTGSGDGPIEELPAAC